MGGGASSAAGLLTGRKHARYEAEDADGREQETPSKELERKGTLQRFSDKPAMIVSKLRSSVTSSLFRRGSRTRSRNSSTTIERLRKIEWRNWTHTTLRILSFLTLEDICLTCKVLNKSWYRLCSKHIQNYWPRDFDEEENAWIKQQVAKNKTFFIRATLTSVCQKVVDSHPIELTLVKADGWEKVENEQEKEKEKEKEKANALSASGGRLSTPNFVTDVQEKIRQRQGHYATFPALAILLLGNLGKPNEKCKKHERLFQFKYREEQMIYSQETFIAHLKAEVEKVYLSGLLDRIRETSVEIQAISKIRTDLDGDSFVAKEYAADGRTITTRGILRCDLTEGLREFTTYVEDEGDKLSRKLRADYKDVLTTMIQSMKHDLPTTLAVIDRDPLVEMHRQYTSLFEEQRNNVLKFLMQASLQPIIEISSSEEVYASGILRAVEKSIQESRSSQRIDSSLEDVLLIVDPAEEAASPSELITGFLERRNRFLSRHYPQLVDHDAVDEVKTCIDAYLDAFIDKRVPPCQDDACCDGSSSLPPSTKRGNSTRFGDLPMTEAAIKAKGKGWLPAYLKAVYVAATAREGQPAKELSDEAFQSLVDFSLRYYIHHVLFRENVMRVINFAPRGGLVPPEKIRFEHLIQLTDALYHAVCRDFGSLSSSEAPERSKEFWTRVMNDMEFIQALAAMSLKQLVNVMETKRKQIKAFEASRRVELDASSSLI